jgi:hypothetical protein
MRKIKGQRQIYGLKTTKVFENWELPIFYSCGMIGIIKE